MPVTFPPAGTRCSERGCTNTAAIYADGAPICWACDEQPIRITESDKNERDSTSTTLPQPKVNQEKPTMSIKPTQDAIAAILAYTPATSTAQIARDLGLPWYTVSKMRKSAAKRGPAEDLPNVRRKKPAFAEPASEEPQEAELSVLLKLTHKKADAVWSALELDDKARAITAIIQAQYEALTQ